MSAAPDAYGFVDDGGFTADGRPHRARRHADCRCPVPCQRRFRCDACGRSKPWCFGAYDEAPGRCDACWSARRRPANPRKEER